MKHYIKVFTQHRADLESIHQVKKHVHVVETPSSRHEVENNLDREETARHLDTSLLEAYPNTRRRNDNEKDISQKGSSQAHCKGAW
jgi:hypothetical protein